MASYGAPRLGDTTLEIQFIEVHERYRGRGTGRELSTTRGRDVERLAAHP